MQQGITALVVAAITVCLLFSYVCLQDSDDAITVREDVVLGHSITWVQTDDNSETIVFETVLEAILDDGNGIFVTYADGKYYDTNVEPLDSLRGEMMADPGMTESIGKGTLSLGPLLDMRLKPNYQEKRIIDQWTVNPASVLTFETEERVLSILEKYSIIRNFGNGECRMTGNKQRLDNTTEGRSVCLGP
ncbi:hypothetical protein, partial [Candidatus Methanarcanum hacksteinii]|uniref:hypothetical protein n=1 Tax=Candidatus Methanarcanum hacksteinii TaxID=2911857 RepID=UPI0037DCAFFC